MVEHLNRQRVLNLLEAYYSGDIEGALSRCSDDVDFVANAPVDILPHLGHRHGKAEVRQMWQTIHARYSSMRYEVPIIVAECDNDGHLVAHAGIAGVDGLPHLPDLGLAMAVAQMRQDIDRRVGDEIDVVAAAGQCALDVAGIIRIEQI